MKNIIDLRNFSEGLHISWREIRKLKNSSEKNHRIYTEIQRDEKYEWLRNTEGRPRRSNTNFFRILKRNNRKRGRNVQINHSWKISRIFKKQQSADSESLRNSRQDKQKEITIYLPQNWTAEHQRQR